MNRAEAELALERVAGWPTEELAELRALADREPATVAAVLELAARFDAVPVDPVSLMPAPAPDRVRPRPPATSAVPAPLRDRGRSAPTREWLELGARLGAVKPATESEGRS